MNLKEKTDLIFLKLAEVIETPVTELNYTNPYELMVSVVLSAQCTDKRVNLVTPAFFEQFPDTKTLAVADLDSVFEKIKSISYPNNKAKHLIAAAQLIENEFDGNIPEKHEDLIKLPGVGRKTANVLVSVLHNMPAMAVDTHVHRVSNRLGIVTAKNVLQTEKQLMELIEDEMVPKAHHYLILHGRYTCKAKNPACNTCNLTKLCDYFANIENSEK